MNLLTQGYPLWVASISADVVQNSTGPAEIRANITTSMVIGWKVEDGDTLPITTKGMLLPNDMTEYSSVSAANASEAMVVTALLYVGYR